MTRRQMRPELLAPAGSFDSLRAAVNMGCDTVYLGAKQFSARQGAENFDLEQLKEVLDYCHIRGVRVFLAVNTIYRNDELGQVLELLEQARINGIDAVIVQDFGLGLQVREYFPDLPLHASTQMTAHSPEDVLYLQEMGFTRAVLSRELSLSEIRVIAGRAPEMELEVFVQGALCICYSGRCLMSSMIGGRSGNRGRCAQPCRQFYSLSEEDHAVAEGYLLSPKDLSLLEWLPALAEAGVTSFKIEGRMRSAFYAAQAVRTFRNVLDNGFQKEAQEKLLRIFNRGGSFTDAYLQSQVGPEMMSSHVPGAGGIYIGTVQKWDAGSRRCLVSLDAGIEPVLGDGVEIRSCRHKKSQGTYVNRRAVNGVLSLGALNPVQPGDQVFRSWDKQLHDELTSFVEKDHRRIVVNGRISARLGQPLELVLSVDSITRWYQGPLAESARSRPLDRAVLIEKLTGTGNDEIQIRIGDCFLEDSVFIPLQMLKQFRRTSVQDFQTVLKERWRRKPVLTACGAVSRISPSPETKISALVRSRAQFLALRGRVHRIYVEQPDQYDPQELTGHYAALPWIDRRENLEEKLRSMTSWPVEGFLIRTWGQLYCLRGSGKKLAMDYSFPVMNWQARDGLLAQGDTVCLSPELQGRSVAELAASGTECLVYGRIPVMTTAACPVGIWDGAKKGAFCGRRDHKSRYGLKDVKGAEFPILTDCRSCTAFILNSRPLYLLDQKAQLEDVPVEYMRMEFSLEDEEETRRILENMLSGSPYGQGAFTRGLWDRGVE